MKENDPNRCDESVPYHTSMPRFHQCRRPWRFTVKERNGQRRHVCKIHYKVLLRQGLISS